MKLKYSIRIESMSDSFLSFMNVHTIHYQHFSLIEIDQMIN